MLSDSPSDDPPHHPGLLRHNRPFLSLWASQVLSQVADKVFFVLLIVLLERYSDSDLSNSLRSLVMVAFTLPAVLFGSSAGIFVDRWTKRTMLLTCNLVRAGLVMLLPLLPGQFWVLLLIAFAVSTATQFFAPAEQAALPLLVRPDRLMTANALFAITMLGAMIVGFAIGDPLLRAAEVLSGGRGREIPICLLYLLAAGCIAQIPITEAHKDEVPLTVNPWRDLRTGIRYLDQNPLISRAVLQLAVLYSVLAVLMVLGVNLAQAVGLEPRQAGFLLAATGVGMLLGAALLAREGQRLRHWPLSLMGFWLVAGVLGLFALVQELWLGLILSVVLGVGGSLILVPMKTLIQRETPKNMLGKVLGFQNNVVNIALSLPLAIAGPLTDWLGLREVLWGLSASVTLLGVRVSKKNRDRRQAAARLESLPSDRPGQQSLKPVARSLDTDPEQN